MDSAKLLGQIHKSMVGIYDDENKEIFWKCIDIENEEVFMNKILKMLETRYDDNNYLSIQNAINHKKNMLYELKKLSKNFIHYEFSNFAKDESYFSKHNSCYWECQNYYGFGLSASGYINNKRYTKTRQRE